MLEFWHMNISPLTACRSGIMWRPHRHQPHSLSRGRQLFKQVSRSRAHRRPECGLEASKQSSLRPSPGCSRECGQWGQDLPSHCNRECRARRSICKQRQQLQAQRCTSISGSLGPQHPNNMHSTSTTSMFSSRAVGLPPTLHR